MQSTLSKLCLLMVAVCTSLGWLEFTADPPTITTSLAENINIKCSLYYNTSVAISKINGIYITRMVKINSGFENFLFIDSPDDKDQSKCFIFTKSAVAVDYCGGSGVATLTINWQNLNVSENGTYRCMFSIVDSNGQINNISQVLEITHKEIGLHLPARTFNLSDWYFPEVTYKNKTYRIPRIFARNYSEATKFCIVWSGYLVEVKDVEEFNILYQMLLNYEINEAYIAGTDEQTESSWIFPRTGEKIKYFNWDQNQPDNYQQNEDCRQIYTQIHKDKINDITCVKSLPFICEFDQL
ncbi:hypothetical protein Btru_047410 [Bulinus truncatus]|nr:hypothetical protein Btru_047410 [Bulinus truncatus]